VNWILVIFIHAGMWSHNDDATMCSVTGFQSVADCQTAAKDLPKLVYDTKQELTWVCIPQPKKP
jgi:hypothetical protein